MLTPKTLHNEAMTAFQIAQMALRNPAVLHDESMGFYEEALARRFRREPETVIMELMRKGYDKEMECLEVLRQHPEANFTRAVICRSAGWMALNIGEIIAAYAMADEGLAIVTDAYERDKLTELNTAIQQLIAE